MESAESGGNSGEMLTLSVGTYSNCIATHYFNLQNPERGSEEVDHNILWSRCRNAAGKYISAPRLLMFDLKENFVKKPVSCVAEKAKEEENSALWEGKVQKVDVTGSGSSVPSTEGNKSEKIWSEYSKWELRGDVVSSFEITSSMRNANVSTVQSYGQGLQCYSHFDEDFTDSVRKVVEPCDHFQGFQLLVDQDDGYSGIASKAVEHIADEYERRTVIGYGVTRPTFQNKLTDEQQGLTLKLANTALTWNCFNQYSSLFTCMGLCTSLYDRNPQPLKIPHMSFQARSDYESSFVLATCLDSFTSPCTLKKDRVHYSEVVSLINAYGRKMTMLGFDIPFRLPSDSSLFEVLLSEGLNLRSILPGTTTIPKNCVANYITSRGFAPEEIIRREKLTQEQLYRLPRITSAKTCLEAYCQETCSASINVVRDGANPFQVNDPFSKLAGGTIFSDLVTKQHKSPGGRDGYCIRSIVSAHNSSEVGDLLNGFVDAQGNSRKAFVTSRMPAACLAEVEQDDFSECMSNLKSLSEAYVSNEI